MIIVEKDNEVNVVNDFNEVLSIINNAKGKIVVIKVMDISEDIIRSKCRSGQVNDCLGEVMILYTNDPEHVKHSQGIEVLDVFNLGDEYAVVVKAPINVIFTLISDEKVKGVEKDKLVRAL